MLYQPNDWESLKGYLTRSSFSFKPIEYLVNFIDIDHSRYKNTFQACFLENEWYYNTGTAVFIRLAVIAKVDRTYVLMAQVYGDRAFIYCELTLSNENKSLLFPIFYNYKKEEYFISLIPDDDDANSFALSGMYDNIYPIPAYHDTFYPESYARQGELRHIWLPVEYPLPLYDFSINTLQLLEIFNVPSSYKIKFWYDSNPNKINNWIQYPDQWLEKSFPPRLFHFWPLSRGREWDTGPAKPWRKPY